MALVISSFNTNPVNVYLAPTTVFTHTMAESGHVGVALYLTSIVGNSATFTVYVDILDGSNNSFGKVSEVFNKNDANTRFRMQFTDSVFVPAGCKVQVAVHTSESGNTYIDCTCYLLNAAHASDAPSVGQIADAVWEESYNEHNTTIDSTAWLLDQLAGLISNVESLAIGILEDTGTTGVVLASSHDVYHADIDLSVDFADTKDEYTVTWFKNGVRLVGAESSASPNLQVVERDGTNLLSETPDAISTTGSYKYTAEGAERITPGEPVIVVASATIDSATRTFARLVSRDKPA